jgi:predicted nucleic acid-binding protein
MNGTIAERLAQNRCVFVDSATFIYLIEEHEGYLPVVRELFDMVEQGKVNAFSSYLSLLEVLVQPLKKQRLDLVQKYKEILSGARGLRLFPIDGEISEEGARIRAQYGFRTPDAIQLATALCHGATAFVTNDQKLKKFHEMDIVLLEEFVS